MVVFLQAIKTYPEQRPPGQIKGPAGVVGERPINYLLVPVPCLPEFKVQFRRVANGLARRPVFGLDGQTQC